MKRTEKLLDHAFALARCARDPVPSELPFGMETAVLAQWRSFLASSKIDVGMLRVFRWAALMACVVAVAGGAWKSGDIAQISQRLDPETRIVNSALLAGLDR
ncbi:MAG: hypothetical protein QOI34_70 [Verrucomicrobiota bacterium]|jgi:hypothetical protein|nr:hypothetical protein [Spartobacteria bacterium]